MTVVFVKLILGGYLVWVYEVSKESANRRFTSEVEKAHKQIGQVRAY